MHVLEANHLGALVAALVNGSAQSTERSSSSAAALLTLFYWGSMTVTEMSRIIGLSQPATTRLLAKLAGRDLVRAAPKEGGRERPVELTQAGAARAKALQKTRLADLDHVLAVLTTKERRMFDDLTAKLLSGIVRDRTHARNICRFCDHRICSGLDCPVGLRATQLEGPLT